MFYVSVCSHGDDFPFIANIFFKNKSRKFLYFKLFIFSAKHVITWRGCCQSSKCWVDRLIHRGLVLCRRNYDTSAAQIKNPSYDHGFRRVLQHARSKCGRCLRSSKSCIRGLWPKWRWLRQNTGSLAAWPRTLQWWLWGATSFSLVLIMLRVSYLAVELTANRCKLD